MGDLRIGTSGWNYPSGRGTWNGVFYPPSRGRAKSFDELSYYAEHFDTVEVNSTFYAQPQADLCRRWVERTPAGFEFSVKLYQKFTHPGMFKERLSAQLTHADPRLTFDEPSDQERLETLARPNTADLDQFRAGIEPLAKSGRLGALLAQFPASFKDAPASRDHLSGLLKAFAGYPVAVELRHRSWSDHLAETLALLNAFNAAWVQIDEPKFRLSIQQHFLPNITGFYYMRLHGRNAGNWWRHQHAEDRYDYLYTADELQDLSTTADAARTLVKKLHLYTNNHFSAKSVANAVMIKTMLGEPVEGAYPPSFIAQFPDLERVVNRTAAAVTLSRTPAG